LVQLARIADHGLGDLKKHRIRWGFAARIHGCIQNGTAPHVFDNVNKGGVSGESCRAPKTEDLPRELSDFDVGSAITDAHNLGAGPTTGTYDIAIGHC